MSGNDDDPKIKAAKALEDEDLEEQLEEASVDQLSYDVSLNRKDEKEASKLDKREDERLQQANKLRGKFFWWGIMATSLCIFTSCFVAVTLTFQRELTTGIATAFITGLTVEIIGVTAIIAKYLFPNKGKTEKD